MDRIARFPTFPELATERLVLRELTAADAPWYLAHFSQPEIVSGQGFPPPADLAAAESELRIYVLDLFRGRTGFRWGIAMREDPGLLGSAGLYKWVDRPLRQAELGYDLAPDAWGRGIMHEALVAILDFAFGPMELERVEALVLASNERSARVLDRLGFVREALLAAHGEDEHGILRDEWRFGLLKGGSVDRDPRGRGHRGSSPPTQNRVVEMGESRTPRPEPFGSDHYERVRSFSSTVRAGIGTLPVGPVTCL